jgi:hypothetical protein
MKTALPYLLFFIAFNSFAQITLEHTYTNSAVTRIKLENSGEKYYELKRETNELFLYNSNHTLWKTILLPATIPHLYAPSAKIINISETKINPDLNIEVVFVYYDINTNKTNCKVFSENGTTLLTILNISPETYLSEISGLPDKLIATGTTETKVYSFPELVLENTYNYGNLKRINLENSGEKYYLLDKTNNNTKIYNANHSLWKTVSLPKPTNATYTDIDFVTETKINSDALLEIGYSLSETVNTTTTYLSKIVNENNVELLNVPSSRKLIINSIAGLADKLMADLPIDYSKSKTNIYNLPSLNLEKSYDSQMTRIKLENSSEKYYTSFRPLDDNLQIFNSDHTFWKTIALTKSINFVQGLNMVIEVTISEVKISNDSSIKVLYKYLTGLLGFSYEYANRVINENGDVLLDAGGSGNLYLSEISGLQNKIIGSGSVYSLNNLSTSDFNKIDKVIMYPNPAKSFINIDSISAPIIEATIVNMNGVLLKKEIAKNITKIDVDKLPAGIYIVNLTDFNNQKSTHKITVSH